MTMFRALAPALTIWAASPRGLRIAILHPDGQAQDLTGRAFTLAVRRSAMLEPLVLIDGIIATDGYAYLFLISADQATVLYEAGQGYALSYDVIETSFGGSTPRWAGRIDVQPSASLPSGEVEPAVIDLPVAEMVAETDTILISERGATGFGVEKRFADKNLITAPDTDLMIAKIREWGGEGGAPYNAEAQAAAQVATDARDIAVDAADRADLAAGQALTAGMIYDDIAAGLAATTNGQRFTAYGPDSLSYATLYLNNAGTAAALRAFPSKAAYDALKAILPDYQAEAIIPVIIAGDSVLLWFDGVALHGPGIDGKALASMLPVLQATSDNLAPLITNGRNVPFWMRDGAIDAAAVTEHFSDIVLQGRVGRETVGDRIPILYDSRYVYIWMDDAGIHIMGLDAGTDMEAVRAYAEPRRASVASTVPMATDGRTLHRARSKLGLLRAGVADTKLKIAVTGDSWAEQSRIPLALRTLIGDSLPIVSPGYRSVHLSADDYYDGPMTFTGGGYTYVDGSATSVFPYKAAPDGHNIWTSGTTFVLTFPFTGPAIDVAHYAYGGTWRWRIDGGSWTAVTDASGGAFTVTALDAGTDAAHVLEIDTVGNGGVVSLAYLYIDRPADGVEVLRMGNGSTTGQMMAGYVQYMQAGLEHLQPDLIVNLLGTNDYRDIASPPAAYIAALEAKLAAERAAVPDVGHIFIIPPQSSGTVANPLSQYRDALYQFAIDNNVEFLNLLDSWPDYATSNALGLWTDTLHTNDAGAQVLVDQINTHFLHFPRS